MPLKNSAQHVTDTHLRPRCTPLIQPAEVQSRSSYQSLSSLLENRSVIQPDITPGMYMSVCYYSSTLSEDHIWASCSKFSSFFFFVLVQEDPKRNLAGFYIYSQVSFGLREQGLMGWTDMALWVTWVNFNECSGEKHAKAHCTKEYLLLDKISLFYHLKTFICRKCLSYFWSQHNAGDTE